MKTKSRKKSETIELPLVTKAAAKAALKKLRAKRAKDAEARVRHCARCVQDGERDVDVAERTDRGAVGLDEPQLAARG